MIPIQLTIEGLYSYQNRQTIDFSDLIDAGLFGIFGAVGSGKSSILEAITFALYGETERLNARDKRTYNMMNLKSNRSYIEFDFEVGTAVYRATREFKRNTKRFDDVKTPSVVFYEQKEGNWVPLNHSNAELLLGLSYENFKRTIIIPQGQFKEFIELGPKDRTQMMKEIFNLHRFDLQDKVAQLNSSNLTELNQLEGKLSGFETVSEENINQLKEILTQQQATLNKAKEDYQLVNNQFQQVKLLKTDFESLQEKKQLFKEQSRQKTLLDAEKKQLETYETYWTDFSHLLKESAQQQESLGAKQTAVTTLQNTLATLETSEVTLTTSLNAVKPQFEALPERRKTLNDLELIVQTLGYAEEINLLKQRSENGKLKVEEVEQKEADLKNVIKSFEEKLAQLEISKTDAQLLNDVSNWFVKNDLYQSEFNKQSIKISELTTQINAISSLLEQQNIEEATFEEQIAVKEQQFNNEKEHVSTERNTLLVQQQMAQYTHNLHNGEACPLCGALEHPAIAVTEDVSNKLEAVNAQLNKIAVDYKVFSTFVTETKQIFQRKQLLKEQLTAEEIALKAQQNQINAHKKLFIWEDFSMNDFEGFEQTKKQAITLEIEIKAVTKELKEQRYLLETEQQQAEKFKNALASFKIEEAQKQTQINQNISNLKVLSWPIFESKNKDKVNTELQNALAEIHRIEKEYELLNTQLNEVLQQIAVQKNSISINANDIQLLQNQIETSNRNIKNTLERHQIETLEIVTDVLSKPIDIAEVRVKIDRFLLNYEGLKQVIENLEIKLKDTSFSQETYDVLLNSFNKATDVLNETSAEFTKTQAEINRLTKAFDDKKELLKTFAELEKRRDNLKVMTNLFKASGFVQYVSSIYLQQLCDNANVRFHKMTRNQLSLQMNENNDFEIIDYLNEGRSRSVKTLSGGQAFQVSLSLALALAESVQANAKSDRNFFFIDEGFGTQDQESVNIVFETLQHLHKENRIVGIISHVEELKERIPVALNITKNEETGSFIEVI